MSKLYIYCSRELTRLESISKSPIVSHYQESLNGVKHIRVFNQSENYIHENQNIIDTNTRVNLSLTGCRLWMRMCLEMLSSLLIVGLFWVAVGFRHDISTGIIALCMAYMFPLPPSINNMIQILTKLENSMISVERVKRYTEIPPEQPLQVSYDEKYSNWPVSPSIKFKHVHLKYRPNTEVVLRGVSFEIPAGTRAGIAGRTGSGKSSLFLALLRIVELDSGIITIDGINIALLGLKKLRESITLIPQDPLVFNGTMKDNLDPLEKHSAQEVLKVLQNVKLQFGLDYEVKNKGLNLSIGERQLLSLCRALICNTKVLLFDEATAGIDPEADAMIQSIIKSKFSGCTILTIAHRIDTIKNSDLIVLLDNGKVAEIGKPIQLYEAGTKFDEFTK